MSRYPDWQLRLAAFARERARMAFAWGSNDCATFAADAVEAMTGERLLPLIRGLDLRHSLVALKARGGVRGLATQALGEPIPALMAQIGDVVVIPAGKREALAVCNGGTAIAPGPLGMVTVSMKQARAAWRVG